MPGYGCEDHFQELDTVEHSWECLAELLTGDATHGILCDVGVPVIHRGVRYNCRAYLLDGRVLLLRPKLSLADDGNYRCRPGQLAGSFFWVPCVQGSAGLTGGSRAGRRGTLPPGSGRGRRRSTACRRRYARRPARPAA